MPIRSSTIWYGTLQQRGEREWRSTPLLAWTGALALFALLRLLLPFHETDAALVHERIVEGLESGLLWGRQGLLGSLEFPTLPTLCLLACRQIAAPLPVGGTHLLVTLAQTWTFFYLLRIPQTLKGRVLTIATFAALLMGRSFQSAFFASDPNWVVAVPVASALYHLIRWQQFNALRDAILLAVGCGLLAFCGPAGIVCALVLLCVGTVNIRRLPKLYDTQNMDGVALLLWAPLAYGVVLLFLGNWLIMGNAFYPFGSLASALAPENLVALPGNIVKAVRAMPWVGWGGLAIAICAVLGRRRVAAEGLAAGLIALLLTQAVFIDTPVHLAAGTLTAIILGVSATLFPGLFLFELFDAQWERQLSITLTALTIFACIALPRPQDGGKALFGTPPPPDEVEDFIDTYWRDARIAVFGMRASARYFDPSEERFLLRVDFYEGELLERAREEQMYLLIPPDNGRFYAPGSKLSELHAHGADWLLLEKSWNSGWQLWRCIVYDQPVETPTPGAKTQSGA
jgi:hypothetical protein